MIHRKSRVYVAGLIPPILEGLENGGDDEYTVDWGDNTEKVDNGVVTDTTAEPDRSKSDEKLRAITESSDVMNTKSQAAEVKQYLIGIGNEFTGMLGKANAPYLFVKYIISLISEWIVYALSMGKAGEDDQNIVSGRIETLIGISLSIWITYNWFFVLLCTKSKLFAPEPIKLYTVDPTDLGHGIITYIFKYITVPLFVVQNLVQVYGKYGFEWISQKFSKHLTILVMFWLIGHMVHSVGDAAMNGFFNAIRCKTDAYLGLWAGMIIAYSLYKTFYVDLNLPTFISAFINPIASAANTYMVFSSPLSLVFSLIVFFLRLAGSLAVGFLTSAMVNGYVILMSLNAISYYKAGVTSTKEVLDKIDEFIMTEKRDPSSNAPPTESIGEYIFHASEDEKETIKYKLTKIAYWIVVYMYLFMAQLAMLSFLLKSVKIYTYDIKNSNLRIALISITCGIILLLCTNIAVSILYRFNEPLLKDKAANIHIGDVSNAATVIATPIQNDVIAANIPVAAKYADGSVASKVSNTAAMLRKKLSATTHSAVSTSAAPGGLFAGLADKLIPGVGSKLADKLTSGLTDKLIPGVGSKIDAAVPSIVSPITTPVALTPVLSAATNTPAIPSAVTDAAAAAVSSTVSSATDAAKASATTAITSGVKSMMSGLLKR